MPEIEVPFEPRGAARQIFDGPHARTHELVLAGPAGTGKTRACLEVAHLRALKYPGSRILFTRKHKTDLVAAALQTFKDFVLHEMDGVTFVGASGDHPGEYRYPKKNGKESKITIGGLDKDAKNIMSREFDMVYLQEAVECSENDWENILTRLRGVAMPYSQLLADCNPSYPTHWLKQRADKGITMMYATSHKDNPLYWDDQLLQWTPRGRAYVLETLGTLTGHRRSRLLEGKWVAAEGQVYPMWDPDTHVIDPFELPASWPRYHTMDFGYCVDTKTEILTSRGWLKYNEITPDDNTLGYDTTTKKAEWTPILDVNAFKGNFDLIEMRNKAHSSVSTVNHRWPVVGKKDVRFVESSELKRQYKVPRVAHVSNLPKHQVIPDRMVELAAWLWTEGQLEASGFVSIWQNEGPYARQIRRTLRSIWGPALTKTRTGRNRAKAGWVENTRIRQGKNPCVQFHLNLNAADEIAHLHMDNDKRIRPEFIAKLTESQLRLFIAISIAGDGFTTKSGTIALTQSRIEYLDALQMACQLASIPTNVFFNKPTGNDKNGNWQISLRHGNHTLPAFKWVENRNEDTIVWCPTTVTGTWLARREGTVYFTGNTNPFFYGWLAEDPDGRLILYRQLYMSHRLVEDHAKLVKSLSTGEPPPQIVICDHDAEDRFTFERYAGFTTTPADKAITVGIQNMQARLRILKDQKPRFMIFKDDIQRGYGLIERDQFLDQAKKPARIEEEFDSYIWPTDPEGKRGEEPIKKDDHGMDATRYIIQYLDAGSPMSWAEGLDEESDPNWYENPEFDRFDPTMIESSEDTEGASAGGPIFV